jgi:hypothetical protein
LVPAAGATKDANQNEDEERIHSTVSVVAALGTVGDMIGVISDGAACFNTPTPQRYPTAEISNPVPQKSVSRRLGQSRLPRPPTRHRQFGHP